MMAVRFEHLDDGERLRKSRRWLCGWQKRIELGDIDGYREHLPIWVTPLAHNTIANILKGHGIEPAPERSRKVTWKEFLSRHWDQIVASDFFTVEVWTPSGLQRFVILFFMELSTRRVEIGGIASRANGLWMTQIARNLTDDVDGFFKGKRYLIYDRDPLYTQEFLDPRRNVWVEKSR